MSGDARMLIQVKRRDGKIETISIELGAVVRPGDSLNVITNPNGLEHFFTSDGEYDGWGRAVAETLQAGCLQGLVLRWSPAEDLATEIRNRMALKEKINRELATLLKQWNALKLKPLKQWLAEESTRSGLAPNTVFCRLRDGKYPNVKKVKLNQRLVWVVTENAELSDRRENNPC